MTTTTATYTLFCWQCGTGFHYPTGHVTGAACPQCRPYHAEALQRQARRHALYARTKHVSTALALWRPIASTQPSPKVQHYD